MNNIEPWLYPATFPATLNFWNAYEGDAPQGIDNPLHLAVIVLTAAISAVATALPSIKTYESIPIIEKSLDGKQGYAAEAWAKIGRRVGPAIIAGTLCFQAVGEVKELLKENIESGKNNTEYVIMHQDENENHETNSCNL